MGKIGLAFNLPLLILWLVLALFVGLLPMLPAICISGAMVIASALTIYDQ